MGPYTLNPKLNFGGGGLVGTWVLGMVRVAFFAGYRV